MTSRSKKKSTAAAQVQNGFSLITNEKLLSLYGSMLRSRMVERHARAQSRPGGKNAVSTGREAAAAGVLLDLRRDDALILGPADVAAAHVKGVPLRSLIAGLGDPAWAGHAPRRVLPACADIATRLALACGAAATARQQKEASLVVVFYDASAPAPASWLQSMRFAARHCLPILFVCWNTRPTRDLYREAERCGFPGIAVEGHDSVAVYRVASEAIAHARRGNGPTFIECKSGFPAGFGGGLFDNAADAIRNMEAYLAGKGLYQAEAKRKIVAAFGMELAAAAGKSRPAHRPRR